MGQRRVTVRDIADALHVSSGTVHRALTGKPGVGSELRARIQQTAKEMGYQPNYLAATLKMKPLRIVLAFPQQEQGNNFYYHYVRQGCQSKLQDYIDYRLDIVEMAFARDGRDETQSFTACMQRLLNLYGKELDGVLVCGLMQDRDTAMIRQLHRAGIPVVMLCDNIAEEYSLCTVQGDHYADGQIAAELLRGRVAPGGKILVCGGSPELLSNSENLRGLLDGLGSAYTVRCIYGVFDPEDLERQLYGCLCREPFQGAYSVTARSTSPLCRALQKLKPDGPICAVGSDLFPENIQALRDGTLDYILFKRPHDQGARGLELLLNYLICHALPKPSQTRIHSVIVIRSNLKFYQESAETGLADEAAGL